MLIVPLHSTYRCPQGLGARATLPHTNHLRGHTLAGGGFRGEAFCLPQERYIDRCELSGVLNFRTAHLVAGAFTSPPGAISALRKQISTLHPSHGLGAHELRLIGQQEPTTCATHLSSKKQPLRGPQITTSLHAHSACITLLSLPMSESAFPD